MAVVILTKILSDRKIEVLPQSKYNIDLSRRNKNVTSKVMIKSPTSKRMDKASNFLSSENPHIRTLNFRLGKEHPMFKWYVNKNFSLKVTKIVVLI